MDITQTNNNAGDVDNAIAIPFAAFDQGTTPTVALVNAASVPFNQWGCGPSPAAFLAAMQKYADLFAASWNTPCKLAFGKSKQPVPNAWNVVFVDDADQAGALGYHELDKSKLPVSYVFVKTTMQAKEAVSTTASHELAEMLADPAINLCAISAKGNVVAYEVADAVEREEFAIDGIPFSDFVTPAYFEPFRTPGSDKFDHLDRVSRPFQILSGGYLPVFKNGQWTQILGSEATLKAFKASDQRLHRNWRRRLNYLDRSGRRQAVLATAKHDSIHWPGCSVETEA